MAWKVSWISPQCFFLVECNQIFWLETDKHTWFFVQIIIVRSKQFDLYFTETPPGFKRCQDRWLDLRVLRIKMIKWQWAVPCRVFQLVMQYLYCGGTDTLHIRNTEVMEVRKSRPNALQSDDTSITAPLIPPAESCSSFSCGSSVLPAAPLCSQILPTRGPSETLWDHLLQEHHHGDLRRPVQTRQGEPPPIDCWRTSDQHVFVAVKQICCPLSIVFSSRSSLAPRSWRLSSRATSWRTWCCWSNSTASSSCCTSPLPPRAPRPAPASTRTSSSTWRKPWPSASAPSTSPPPRAPWCDVEPPHPPNPNTPLRNTSPPIQAQHPCNTTS